MDGNGRWAKKRRLPRLLGHRAGVKALERTVDAAGAIGIKFISFYAFSTENWKRPEKEIMGLMSIFKFALTRKIEEFHGRNGRLRFAGFREGLPGEITELMAWAEEKTKDNTGLTMIPCFNYGGRQEILHAVEKMIRSEVRPPLTEEVFRNFLYLPDVPDPDLVIRTSGETRISNFWLWQSSYSELYFTDVLWPDFDGEELGKALEFYRNKERRYGALR
ncbi:MAG: di-trans,poly-cis-decaprenylcistransferase [Synergistaceae bacterium]|nr:polyprenyl diphosphate synthase [Synergistota bacterium]NLM71649.1 di-trans,poly-cis-decaprenylcistransferase [Synergistaceae bacterium]